jgi:hypothetical protein
LFACGKAHPKYVD